VTKHPPGFRQMNDVTLLPGAAFGKWRYDGMQWLDVGWAKSPNDGHQHRTSDDADYCLACGIAIGGGAAGGGAGT